MGYYRLMETTHLYPQLNEWLKASLQAFGKDKVCILSNKPTETRYLYFLENFQGLEFIRVIKKKPYPEGLLYILQKMQLEPKELLVIDDRLLTGILAAVLVGARGCLITKPWVCLSRRPIQESLFIVLRKLERLVF